MKYNIWDRVRIRSDRWENWNEDWLMDKYFWADLTIMGAVDHYSHGELYLMKECKEDNGWLGWYFDENDIVWLTKDQTNNTEPKKITIEIEYIGETPTVKDLDLTQFKNPNADICRIWWLLFWSAINSIRVMSKEWAEKMKKEIMKTFNI